jgi:hypothetical protein
MPDQFGLQNPVIRTGSSVRPYCGTGKSAFSMSLRSNAAVSGCATEDCIVAAFVCRIHQQRSPIDMNTGVHNRTLGRAKCASLLAVLTMRNVKSPDDYHHCGR